MIGLIIYLIGCIAAFLICKNCLSNSSNYEDEGACTIYAVGTLLSWVIVVLYLYKKYFSVD